MKIIVLGSGFVGRNLVDSLSSSHTVFKTSRAPQDNSFIHFELGDFQSWHKIIEINPDVIINAIAFGVVKNETDLEVMYEVNYRRMADFYNYLVTNECRPFWIQLGTAFEYDLSAVGGITEQSPCLPRTHYGISKLMFSQFLLQKGIAGNFCIFRPFGMFGKYEDESKFFPMLIEAQINKQAIKLSEGIQKRDYVFVNDVTRFINQVIITGRLPSLPKVLNLGAGEAKSLKDYAMLLGSAMGNFDPALWQWGAIDFRANESNEFYNSSKLAFEAGFVANDLRAGFSETAKYYFSK